jgi:hypothetical protein
MRNKYNRRFSFIEHAVYWKDIRDQASLELLAFWYSQVHGVGSEK